MKIRINNIFVSVLFITVALAYELAIAKEYKSNLKNKATLEAQITTLKGVWTEPHVSEDQIDQMLAITQKTEGHPVSPMEIQDSNGSTSDIDKARGSVIIQMIINRMDKSVKEKSLEMFSGASFFFLCFKKISVDFSTDFMDKIKLSRSETFFKYTTLVTLKLPNQLLEEILRYDPVKKILEFLVVYEFQNYSKQLKASNCEKQQESTKALNEFNKEHLNIKNEALKLVEKINEGVQSNARTEVEAFSQILLTVFTKNLQWFCQHSQAFEFSADKMINLLKMQFAELENVLLAYSSSVTVSSQEKTAIAERMNEARQQSSQQANSPRRSSLNYSQSERLNRPVEEEENKERLENSLSRSLTQSQNIHQSMKKSLDSSSSKSLNFNQINIEFKDGKNNGAITSPNSPFIFSNESASDDTFVSLNIFQVNIFYVLRAWFTMHTSDSDQEKMIEKLMELVKVILNDLNTYLEFDDAQTAQPPAVQSNQSGLVNSQQLGSSISKNNGNIEEKKALIKQEKTKAAFVIIERSLNRVLQMVSPSNSKSGWVLTALSTIGFNTNRSKLDDSLITMWNMIKRRVGENNAKNSIFATDFANLGDNLLELFELKKATIDQKDFEAALNKLEDRISDLEYTNWRCNFLVHLFFYGYGSANYSKLKEMPIHAKVFFLRNFQCMYNQHRNFYTQVSNMIVIHKSESKLIPNNAAVASYRRSVLMRMFFLQQCYDEQSLKGNCKLERYERFLTEAYLTAFEIKAGISLDEDVSPPITEIDSIPLDPWVSDNWLNVVWERFEQENINLEARYKEILNRKLEKDAEVRDSLHWIYFPLLKLQVMRAQRKGYLTLISNPLAELHSYLGLTSQIENYRGLAEYLALKKYLEDAIEKYYPLFNQKVTDKLYSLTIDKKATLENPDNFEQIVNMLEALSLARTTSNRIDALKYESPTEKSKERKLKKNIPAAQFESMFTQFSSFIELLNKHEIQDLDNIIQTNQGNKFVI